jgi:hypothetical protein
MSRFFVMAWIDAMSMREIHKPFDCITSLAFYRKLLDPSGDRGFGGSSGAVRLYL